MKKVAHPEIVVPPVAVRRAPAREVVFVPEKANVDVLLGHQGVLTRTDPEYYPAMIANYVFGGSASARLFQEVRDRLGLTYGIYSSLSSSHGAGPWSVWMTLNPSNVEQAVDVVKRLSRELVQKGLTDAELEAAKETLVGKYKVGLATNSGMAGALALFEGYGLPSDFVDEHIARLQAVTKAQVSAVLKKYFHPDSLLEVVAG
ncbi:MAG TPA: hypothetical protein DFS52_12195, partial [Myxococcales bacterium]|nr:hypothetical protein [Myxococcales bacterium]